MKHIYPLLAVLLLSLSLSAQCYQPQTLADRVLDGDLIVIGEISNSEPFYNNWGQIYTRHTIAVDLVASLLFPNPYAGQEITFFTMGGTINEEKTVAYPSLRGIEDADGLFILKQYNGEAVDAVNGLPPLMPVAVHESYLAFDDNTGNFTDGGVVVGDLQQIINLVGGLTGQRLQPMTDRRFEPQTSGGRSMMPTVSSISPINVNAGVGDVITINGSGFGSSRGSVFFDNPDDGPGGRFTGTPDEAILSWTDSRIRVRVVSEAGSGRILVQTAGEVQGSSSQSINVGYAITNLTLGSGAVVTPRLIDDAADGNGGYSFLLSNSTANGGQSIADNAAARAALQRAVSTWQQADYSVYASLEEGTTSVQRPIQGDDVNIISFGSSRFDFDDELGSGTVGIAYSYYSACGSSEFEVVGMDVLFRRNGNPNGRGGSVNYNFTTGSGSGTDFESVALHELGHTLQLKHVAEANDVMSFRITNGATQRTLSAENQAAAAFVIGLADAYDPPIINCGGDFGDVRNYVRFSQLTGQLPVELTAFTARPAGKVARLDWTTASEIGSQDFTVQHSLDGRTFTDLGRVMAAGTSSEERRYGYDHLTPASGINYYRLSQRDLDGTTTLSDVRPVEFSELDEVSLFPNPAYGQVTLRHGELTAGTTVDLIDAKGTLLRQITVVPSAPSTLFSVADLPAGLYQLRIGERTERLVVR